MLNHRQSGIRRMVMRRRFDVSVRLVKAFCPLPTRLFQHMGEASKVAALKAAANAGVAPAAAQPSTGAASTAPPAAAAAAPRPDANAGPRSAATIAVSFSGTWKHVRLLALLQIHRCSDEPNITELICI